jgi:hypothetical protein
MARDETGALITWWCILVYICSARRISIEINSKTTDFKKKSIGQNANNTRIYPQTPLTL